MWKTGALVIASCDYAEDNRDNEGIPVYLPMYPLDGTTVIKREIAVLRRAGLSPIMVLLGYQKELLKNHLSHNGVLYVEDRDWQKHDLASSAALGIQEAAGFMDRLVVLPVEYPAFSRETLEQLLSCPGSAVPVYEGKSGYPRLYVLKNSGETDTAQCPVEDPGVILSMKGEEGVRRVEQYVRERRDANTLSCRTRLVLSKEEDFFGPEVYELLKAIDETGSIQAAAARMHISYTKGWKMVNQVEKEMGLLFLNRLSGGKNGGSSEITGEGRLFMERYHAMEEDMKRICQQFFDTYFCDFQ